MRILVKVMFILAQGRPVPNFRRGRDIFGFSVPDELTVDHKITEEDIILYDQVEKLLYTSMEQLMPTSANGKEEHL